MEPVRRCKECRRIVKGHAGNACPFCGSAELVTIIQHSSSDVQHHPSIMASALTFCAGAIALRLVARLAGGRLGGFVMAEDLVASLQVVVCIATLLYLLLRRSEGDFRSLFIVTFGLFCTTEGLSVMSRTYGLYTLESLIMVVNIGVFIYSSLSVTASLADGPKRDPYPRVLMGASAGFMLFATLRTFLGLRSAGFDRKQEIIIVIVLAAIAVHMLVLLMLAERSGASRKSAPADQAAPVAQAGDGLIKLSAPDTTGTGGGSDASPKPASVEPK
jgi:hypothetical protein